MARKLKLADLDNLISRYQAGESVQKLISEWSISLTTFYRLLNRHNIPRCQLIRATPPNLIARYLAGESELALSKSTGLTRTVIRKRLLDNGIIPRNGSQANIIRMGRLSDSERQQLSAAAHTAIKGSCRPIAELEARAITRQNNLSTQSPTERKFIKLLRKRGFEATPQKACGKYNIDIALESEGIAVEIYGGSWHANGRAAFRDKERIPYLLNTGWHLIIIWVDNTRYPLTIKAVNYIITLSKRLCLNKPLWREYHMIRGDGHPMTIPSFQFKGETFIPSPTASHHI